MAYQKVELCTYTPISLNHRPFRLGMYLTYTWHTRRKSSSSTISLSGRSTLFTVPMPSTGWRCDRSAALRCAPLVACAITCGTCSSHSTTPPGHILKSLEEARG